MSQDESSLSMFTPTIRKKIRFAKQLGDLLHLMYLIIKDKACLAKAVKYESFSQLLENPKFVASVLIESSLSSRSTYKYAEMMLEKALRYKEIFRKVKERYSLLADLIERWWNITVRTMTDDNPCKAFYGPQSLESNIKFFSCKVQKFFHCLSNPLRFRIGSFRLVVIEVQSAKPSGLAKTLVFIGRSPYLESCFPQLSSLDMFIRFSIAQVDVDRVVDLQRKDCAYEVSNYIWLYPTVLRMRRTSYRRFRVLSNQLNAELLDMYSKLYMDENKLSALLSGEVPFNIMVMASSITLGSALCFPAVFVGELLSPLTVDSNGVWIKASSDISLRGYLSSFSLGEHTYIGPGYYLFFTLHPVTAPNVALVYNVLSVDAADRIKPRTRYVQRFDKLFPNTREALTRRGFEPSEHL